jgi:hypothetical protein
MTDKFRKKGIDTAPKERRTVPHRFGDGLAERIKDTGFMREIYSKRIEYVAGPVKRFDTGKYKGIGKNYDGYRAIWAPTDGFNVYDSMGIKCMELGDRRVELFKQDVLEAAGRDPVVAAFLKEHGKAMGI